MQKTKKRKFLGVIAGVLTLATLVGTMSGCSFLDELQKIDNVSSNNEIVTEIAGNQIVTEITDNEEIRLFSSTPVYDEVNKTISKTITATVYPEYAVSKAIDWSVEWGTNNEGAEAIVTDYVTVTPAIDGGNVATITVHKPFLNSDINVVATTRANKKTAKCNVTYVGTPSDITFTFDGQEYLNGDTIYTMTSGSVYNIKLNPKNILGVVDESRLDWDVVSMTGEGSFKFYYTYYDNTLTTMYESAPITQSLSSFTTVELSKFVETMFDISTEGSYLKIDYKHDITDFTGVYEFTSMGSASIQKLTIIFPSYTCNPQIDGVGEHDAFYYHDTNLSCSINIAVREKVSGTIKNIKICLNPDYPTSISLSDSSLVF